MASDSLTPAQRRHCMRRVKNKNTKPELLLRRALWARGFRYRLQVKMLGRPDLLFVGARLVVFVDGCFWHGCPLHHTLPQTNRQYWHEKLTKNMGRDQQVSTQLEAMGWRVLRFWEHELKRDLESVLDQVARALGR